MPNMHQLALCFSCLLFSVAVSASEIINEAFHSKTTGIEYHYSVYLPDTYLRSNASDKYPALYLLHGSNDNEHDWLVHGGVRETLDTLIASRQIQPMIVIMPRGTGTWWINGAKVMAETELIKELMPHAEMKYRVISGGKRLIAGLSAGGYGALNLMLKYPQMIGAAAILSPAIYNMPSENSAARRLEQFQNAGKFDPDLWRSLNYRASLASYKNSGIIVPLYISSGDHDKFGIALESAILYEELRIHQVNALELHIERGDHEWLFWRNALRPALLFLNSKITTIQQEH